MNKLERWIMTRIIKKEVRQGYDHHRRISRLYGMIRKACEEEFTEDNEPTLDHFLETQFKTTYED